MKKALHAAACAFRWVLAHHRGPIVDRHIVGEEFAGAGASRPNQDLHRPAVLKIGRRWDHAGLIAGVHVEIRRCPCCNKPYCLPRFPYRKSRQPSDPPASHCRPPLFRMSIMTPGILLSLKYLIARSQTWMESTSLSRKLLILIYPSPSRQYLRIPPAAPVGRLSGH